jgi:hypothetical protein
VIKKPGGTGFAPINLLICSARFAVSFVKVAAKSTAKKYRQTNDFYSLTGAESQ